MTTANRGSFKLEANGPLAAGVADRHNATASGTVTNMSAVLGTAPTTADCAFELRNEGTVAGTGTIPVGQTEVNVDLIPNLPSNRNNQDFLPGEPPQQDTRALRFGEGSTFELNVVTPGGAGDLDLTVGTSN